MTLPFGGRRDDADGPHERARALSSRRFLERLDPDDDGWLNDHLEACAECREENVAFAADRELLRTLRDEPIEPPRDLWARTAAALDAAATKRAFPAASRRPFSRAMPIGAAAGVVVLLVVIGSALLPGVLPSNPPPVGLSSLQPGPTPIVVAAERIGLLRPSANGQYEFVFTDVDAVCPRARPECVPPPSEQAGSTVDLLGARASTVTLSPNNNQLVFESEGGTATEGKIVVVSVAPNASPSQRPATPPVSSPAQSGGSTPPPPPPGSASPAPNPTAAGQIEIASGVTIIGDVEYSSDGNWLAFSAAPKDGSTGPDLYIYSVGSGTAIPVTTDHQTYFSAWLGSKVLASRLIVPADEPATPGQASSQPGASGPGNNGQGNGGQDNNGQGEGRPIEARAASFVFDPTSDTRTELSQQDVWMPVVDPTSHFVAYWSGTLRSNDGKTWQLGAGHLVLDGWSNGMAAAADSTPASRAASPQAEATPAPLGPTGQPMPIVTSHVEDFVTRFDPDGVRLAVWVSDHVDGSTDGRLHLFVIEPTTRAIRTEEPLPGEPALRRFSIEANRLAWVSPSGQDGHESSLQVLGWSGETFGQVHSEPTADLLILH